ncbi:uncharacterized protein LOC143877179 isoform X2 [Tasmannia lanceolata]|uniref:uncharacterized protein LOC143877179 isoform X2 n=1 Tax=Tasmannia lanceolata TaxID=3420 RepID=UPI00406282CD
MEGLIKGLINVALGNNQDEDERPNNPSHSQEEERTRSTWAQVVSGEKEEEEEPQNNVEYGAHHYNQQNPWNRRRKEEDNEGRNEEGGWETVTERPPPPRRRHQQEEDNEGRDQEEGWETVAERPPPPQRRHQKVSMENRHGYKQPPSEQGYSEEVDYGADIEPSAEELSDLSKACSRLWELDLNRLVPGKDYEIDCGEGKKTYQKEDMAQGSLFSWMSDNLFKRPTYSRFSSLLDNYNPNEGSKEVVTSQERQEQAAFIEEISRTAPIKYLYKYLLLKGIIPEHYEGFKRILTGLWFDLYNRGGTSGSSSAFEHVFVGEIKQRGEHEVSGFHNWIQFYLEEAKGKVDYQGYIFPRRRGEIPDSETQLLTIQFEWNGVLKSISSILVGVSPEFEIALFTLCFYLGGEDNYFQLGPYPVNIKCYRLGRDKIGSVFPIAQS